MACPLHITHAEATSPCARLFAAGRVTFTAAAPGQRPAYTHSLPNGAYTKSQLIEAIDDELESQNYYMANEPIFSS